MKEKRKIVEISFRTGEGHIASAFSVLDILDVLYGKILNVGLRCTESEKRDVFIMSKGHASIGLYVILGKYGFFPENQLETFGAYGSILGGHPDKNKVPGVEVSTGSLGHGLPIAVGMAMAYKIQNKENRIYVLVGDGELNEGSMWEAILLAAEHNLNNLVCLVDYNHSTDRAVHVGDLAKKFAAFDWEIDECDGHNQESLENKLRKVTTRPRVIICNTIKGKGCLRMENNPEWHHKSPNQIEFGEIMEELEQ